MDRRHFAALALTSLAMTAAARPALAAKPGAEWDGLVKVKAKRFDKVYLRPGADFRGYTKVILDPTEIAFEKNWQRDYNNNQRSTSLEVTDRDIQRMIEEGRKSAAEILQKAYTAGGYPVVTEPASDVLRVRTSLIDIIVRAPDVMGPANVRTYSRDAGEITLVVEARDSLTGSLLGRVVDDRTIDDFTMEWRNRVTNRMDFDRQVESWAKNSVKGLNQLKTLSPIAG
ncbi:hypothetical protein ASD38_17365 [Caulobacter sp. Root487D2Y]|uniref:DUF3313 family protein n=1 Tax=Caulobacter sp. Root487D2Y TaxID=1736547 RepID=UPI0006F5CE29|nr:DUF3313 family protein [Caulobacter sp. Root487D2Y]KQY27670.1 hypothetical protein ASD38_17365 [Caulobacter sp. Root487D2Y]